MRPGCLLRRSALGSEALYRVVEVHGDLVEVQVVSAPGLEPGTRIRLTTRDAAAMQPVDEPSPSAEAEQQPGRAVPTAD